MPPAREVLQLWRRDLTVIARCSCSRLRFRVFFKWRQFEPEVILLAVGWYLRFSLSYREVEELLPERGLSVDHVTVWRVGAALRPRNSAPMATPRSFVARLGSVCRSCRPNGHYLHPNRIFMKTPSNSSPATFIEGALGRIAPTVLRWALGATLLSAVADRFGLWGPPGGTDVSWGDWAHFVAYTAKVNSFLPPPLLRGSRSLPRRSSLRSVWVSFLEWLGARSPGRPPVCWRFSPWR
jgi:hypothetical protein